MRQGAPSRETARFSAQFCAILRDALTRRRRAVPQPHIELSMPLECILLQSDVPVELLDVESNQAVVRRPRRPTVTGPLAMYRLQEAVSLAELRVRTVEAMAVPGRVPRISPKACRAATYPIKPLSLHTRLLEPVSPLPTLNSLTIKGGFQVAEVHSWVVACLPEVPAKLQVEEASFTFRNTFLETLLLCEYKQGHATFQSDSVTTLATIKEVLTKEATARKIQIQISVDVKEETVASLLTKIDPMLVYQHELAAKVKLIETLKEVKMQETDSSFLAPEYQQILENEGELQRAQGAAGYLQFLHGIVTDVYLDHYKFKEQNVAGNVPKHQRILERTTARAAPQILLEIAIS